MYWINIWNVATVTLHTVLLRVVMLCFLVDGTFQSNSVKTEMAGTTEKLLVYTKVHGVASRPF